MQNYYDKFYFDIFPWRNKRGAWRVLSQLTQDDMIEVWWLELASAKRSEVVLKCNKWWSKTNTTIEVGQETRTARKSPKIKYFTIDFCRFVDLSVCPFEAGTCLVQNVDQQTPGQHLSIECWWGQQTKGVGVWIDSKTTTRSKWADFRNSPINIWKQ